MRWLYHLVHAGTELGESYAPASLAAEGFIHASFRDAVKESASLHFPPGSKLDVLCIDPRRLPAPVVVAETPRGGMPHVHGPVPADAVRARLTVEEASAAADRVTGTRYALVAFDGMTLLDLVGVYDPISRIASMGFDPAASCEIVSADGARVWRGAGGELVVSRARPPLEAFDVVVVAGGPRSRALAADAEVSTWIATFPRNRPIASVCTGALLLGAAGRLRGRRATTHHTAMDLLAAYGATPSCERVVDEWPVVTAAGVTSGIDLGLHLVARFEGAEVAREMADQMEHRAPPPVT